MKRILLVAVSGLLCVGAVREGVTAPASTAPNTDADTPPRAGYLAGLEEYYARGKTLYAESRSHKLSDKEVNVRFDAFIAWANAAGKWMDAAMGPAATARFTTWHAEFGAAEKLSGRHPDEANNKFSTLNVVLPQLLENLRLMIASDAGDRRNAAAGGSK